MITSALLTAATPLAAAEFDILENILATRGVVLAVLVVLVLMSVLCWAIILYKAIWFGRVMRVSKGFIAAYWEAQNPNEVYDLAKEVACPESRIFVAGFRELGHLKARATNQNSLHGGFENIERAVRRVQAEEISHFESYVSFLGTTGSTAPFIGLFGTVWGIMMAFGGIGAMDEKSNLLKTVTPHIAEALVATAIGLLAAIPAVMAYNYFVRRIRIASTAMDGFSVEFLNTLRRLYFQA